MKKSLLFLAIIAAVFCLSANKNVTNSLLVVLDPILPENAYDYSITIPEHIVNNTFGSFGEVILDDILEVDNDIATLGRVLFYDEVLSSNQNIACATCHLQSKSFADEFAVSTGVNGETRRNSMHLNDLGWTSKEGFFWDQRELELANIIEIPLTDGNELGVTEFEDVAVRMLSSSYYPDLFEKAFGDANDITQDKVVEALVHFISSITSFNSKFDRVMQGEDSFTQEEQNGLDHYRGVCTQCHTSGEYPDFGEEPFFELFPFLFANGFAPTNDLGMGEFYEGLEHLFKIPTLRNIALTGPYMHNGEIETLEEVIRHYSEEAVDDGWGFVPVGGFGFNDQQQAEIVAFLNTMTDETLADESKWSDPFATSLNDEDVDIESLNIKVFPNPTSNYFSVELDNPFKLMINGALFSSSGKLIKKYSTHGGVITAQVAHLPADQYVFRLNIGTAQISKNIVVQH